MVEENDLKDKIGGCRLVEVFKPTTSHSNLIYEAKK